jgi:ligand-binding sensor domain-containing protein
MEKFFTIIIIFLSPVIQTFGQSPFFQQYVLSRKSDIVQVNAILQEKRGHVWIGTSKGLYRLDGKKQLHFTSKQGLAHDVVTALAEDSLGKLWIGFEDGQIGCLYKSKFELFSPPEGSATKAISDILFDTNGNMWFSTLNDGLYFYKSGRLHRVDEAEGMPDLYIYDLAQDAKGNIWAGTDGGAAICSLNNSKVAIDVINYEDGLPDNIVRKIIVESDGSILMATEDAGIIKLDLNSRKIESLLPGQWNYGTVTDFELKGDKVWIGCPQKGLLVYDRKTQEEVLHTLEQQRNLSAIRTLEKDFEGNIWIGTKSEILRTPGDALQFLDQPVPDGNSNVLAVTADHHNNLWFSTGDGLFKRKLNGTNQSEEQLLKTSFKNYTVISLYTDPKGYIWAGLYGEGVLRIHPESGKIEHFLKELRNGNILSITGTENTVWLATLGGSTEITLAGQQVTSIKNYSSKDGLISDFIYQVLVDNDRVWFATDGKGLGMMDNNGFHHYDKGLPSKVVYGMAKDANQKLWVNIQGHGLYVFENEKFIQCDSTLVLRDNNIHSVAADKAGNIIVMHDVGMDIIDVQRRKVVHLGEEIGMRDKIANLNAVGNDTQGNIYLGTSGGIIKYSSGKEFFTNRPIAYIEQIYVFDSVMDIGSSPTLRYDEDNITIHFQGLWYKNPEGLYYSYKLENYDRDWIATGNQAVTYSRIPPGAYTFRIKVSETTDFSDAEEATIAFRIRPPFWQTIPFYISAVIVLVAVVFVVIKSRERKLRRYNELLEGKVQLRTREIQIQNEEIQVQNEEISAQSEEILRINENLEEMVQERTRDLERKNKALEDYAFINAHKLRSPVATILGLINLISKTRLDEDRAEINRRLQVTADELDTVVNSITKAIERGNRKIPKMRDD